MSASSVSNIALQSTTSLDSQPVTAKSAFWQQYLSQRRPEVQQLKAALDAGDLSAAQQAYNNLVALGHQVLHKDNPFVRQDRALDFNAIGGALRNGDLQGARQAFAALRATFRHKVPPSPTASVSPTAADIALSSELASGSVDDAGTASGSTINVVA